MGRVAGRGGRGGWGGWQAGQAGRVGRMAQILPMVRWKVHDVGRGLRTGWFRSDQLGPIPRCRILSHAISSHPMPTPSHPLVSYPILHTPCAAQSDPVLSPPQPHPGTRAMASPAPHSTPADPPGALRAHSARTRPLSVGQAPRAASCLQQKVPATAPVSPPHCPVRGSPHRQRVSARRPDPIRGSVCCSPTTGS